MAETRTARSTDRPTKAILAGVLAGLAVLTGAVSNGGIGAGEYLESASAALVGFQAVYWTSNKR